MKTPEPSPKRRRRTREPAYIASANVHKGLGKKVATVAGVTAVVVGIAFFVFARRAPLNKMVSIKVEPATVRMGGEIEIRAEGTPAQWHGDLLVGQSRHFEVNSKLFRLKVAPEHGFRIGPTELYFVLTDSNGYQVPVSNNGRFSITVPETVVNIDQVDRSVESRATAGNLEVTAPRGYKWAVSGVPDWVSVTPLAGSGGGKVMYKVAANESNDPRSATLMLGDATFVLTQGGSFAIQLPYRDTFTYTTPPPVVSGLVHRGYLLPAKSPTRWYYDEIGTLATLSLGGNGPGGTGTLIATQPRSDSRPWATQIVLPSINVEIHKRYKVSAWMKAQNPGPVSMLFGQSTAPYSSCGLGREFTVSQEWAEYSAVFTVNGERCDSANNRFMFATGRIAGSLSIANFSFVPHP